MSLHRFFLTAPLAETDETVLPLAESDARHAAVVLRVRVGEDIEVVEPTPSGAAWRVRVTGVVQGDDGVASSLSARRIERLADGPALPNVVLFQGVAKGEKMDDIVRQVTEIGVAEVVPVITSRTIVKLDERKCSARGDRWRRIAESAAKQSHRVSVPEVTDPVTLADVLSSIEAFDIAIVLWEECDGDGIIASLAPFVGVQGARVAVFVGPEGGFSAEEIAALELAGARTATLGPTILRTETAAVVASALALSALGGLGARS